MNKTLIRISCLFVCFLVLFTGCSSANTDGNQASVTPKGKYIESDVTPPNLDGHTKKLHLMPDGSVVVIAIKDEGGIAAYQSQSGSSWAELDTTGLNAYWKKNITLEISEVTLDTNLNWWIANCSVDGVCRLYKVSSNGDGQEIKVSGLDKPSDNGYMSRFVTEILYEKSVIFIELRNDPKIEYISMDAESGSVLNTFSPQGSPFLIGCMNGNAYISPSYGSSSIDVYAISNGAKTNTFTLPNNFGLLNSPDMLSISADNALNMVMPSSIEKIILGGSMVQTVTDNRAYVFASPGLNILSFVAGSNNEFWLAGDVGGNSRIYRYWFDENAPVNAKKHLSIWAMEDNALLREAMSVFARENPDYDLQVEFGRDGSDSGQTDEDIIRALNTKLLAEDSPDVLILDGLPIEAMIQQGLLTDLSGIVDKSDYYENILNAYTVDGKDYAYPMAFQMPVIVKREGTPGPGISGISARQDFENILKDKNLVYFGGYSHLFDALYASYAPVIFPGGVNVDENVLREFLEMTKAVVDSHGIGGTEIDPIATGIMTAVDTGAGVVPLSHSPSLELYAFGGANTRNYAVDILKEFWNYTFLDLTNSTPVPEPLPGGVFIPKSIAGVPAGAQNVEGGKLFVKTMLENQNNTVTQVIGRPGYLVRRGVELKRAMEYYDQALANMGEANYAPDNPSLVDWDMLISKFTLPGNPDIVLRDKLYEQAKKLYSGEISLDDAVNGVLKNTQIYFAERQ